MKKTPLSSQPGITTPSCQKTSRQNVVKVNILYFHTSGGFFQAFTVDNEWILMGWRGDGTGVLGKLLTQVENDRNSLCVHTICGKRIKMPTRTSGELGCLMIFIKTGSLDNAIQDFLLA